MHCVQSVCCAVLRAHVDATTVPRAWLALRLFLPLLALRGVTVLITRVRLLHFDKDYNNYTASPLRAFENELGGGPSSSGGELLRPCGARGLSVFTSDVLPQSSTEVLEISQCIATLRFLLTIYLLRCANQLAWTIELCSDLFTLLLSCLLGLSWALHSCFGHCLALPFFRLCASRRPRARLCRFVGGRRYRALRRRSASRRTRPCGFLRWTTVLLAYSWAFWPCVISVGWACLHPCPVHALISTCIFAARSPACIPFASALLLRCSLDLLRLLRFILSVVRTISHRLGLLACRVGEASHPGPSSDSMRKDPWADFLARKHKQATPVDSNAAFKPQRTPWTQCTLDLSQLQKADDLQHLSLDSFAENAEGICAFATPAVCSSCQGAQYQTSSCCPSWRVQ